MTQINADYFCLFFDVVFNEVIVLQGYREKDKKIAYIISSALICVICGLNQ